MHHKQEWNLYSYSKLKKLYINNFIAEHLTMYAIHFSTVSVRIKCRGNSKSQLCVAPVVLVHLQCVLSGIQFTAGL